MEIDRKALVRRHNPLLKELDPDYPLSVGNGELAYTADGTGFQNFIPEKKGTMPLCTMTQWGFHSYKENLNREENYKNLKLREFDLENRKIGYMSRAEGQEELYHTLRVSPHKLNLVRIHLMEKDSSFESDFREIHSSNVSSVDQELDLWTGELRSYFFYKKEKVFSTVLCHPHRDILSIKLSSPLLRKANLAVFLSFPYASHDITASDWEVPHKHRTEMSGSSDKGRFNLKRILDTTEYYINLKAEGSDLRQVSAHSYAFVPSGDELEFSLSFSEDFHEESLPSFDQIQKLSHQSWESFWSDSAIVQLINSRDPRAKELERRIILSRYLTAIQCSGSLPPQETGLTCNSWYGKFHLEMHPLHSLHFPLWGNSSLLKNSLEYYRSIAERAKERAHAQGYRGLRWPKMTDPQGYDSPSPIATLLCWQQPHFIYFCEMLRLCNNSDAIVFEYGDLLIETAEFMADYVVLNKKTGFFDLAAPLIPAQENHDPDKTHNPTFELEYWHWGLSVAIKWMDILGKSVPEKWLTVRNGLSPSPVDSQGEVYLSHEKCPESYGQFATDHPSFLMAFGFLPGSRINRDIMSASLDKVLLSWDFNTSWGWDFPMMAMTATLLDRRKDAVDLLLLDAAKNSYSPNGHNVQIPRSDLPLYLPGNGSLLLAVALMVDRNGRGFPNDGTWTVESEGFREYPI